MIQIKIGTTQWQACPSGVPMSGHVLYQGDWQRAEDGITDAMVWDATIANPNDGALGYVRPMTAAEIAAIPAQKQAERDARDPELAALRDAAVGALAVNNAHLGNANPNNAQLVAHVRALTQQQNAMLKCVARLAARALA